MRQLDRCDLSVTNPSVTLNRLTIQHHKGSNSPIYTTTTVQWKILVGKNWQKAKHGIVTSKAHHVKVAYQPYPLPQLVGLNSTIFEKKNTPQKYMYIPCHILPRPFWNGTASPGLSSAPLGSHWNPIMHHLWI